MNRARLEQRKRDDHAQILATRAQRAMPPPTSWWAQRDLTWEQWTALAQERARQLNAVTTTQHVRREEC
jgi:hypothetical protein